MRQQVQMWHYYPAFLMVIKIQNQKNSHLVVQYNSRLGKIGKGLGRLCSNKIINLDEQEVTLGKKHLRTTCP